jgi:5'-deoxynucleotidase YfbR-like HD superfamily hydrolase
MERYGDWFQTYTGIQFWPLDPRPEECLIEDIAHALALQCRFNGHCKYFYSIAQHSVLVSKIVKPENALWGLMHDAAEAYVGDMVRPLKSSQPFFREVEAKVMAAICDKFGLPRQEPSEVKKADDIVLMTEKRDLLVTSPAKWIVKAEPMSGKIVPLSTGVAEVEFLERFNFLYRRNNGI